MNETEFVGALGIKTHIIESIRTAFNCSHSDFNLCAIHKLPNYNTSTFASWVKDLHCKDNIDPDVLYRAKLYVINYLLCPESQDTLDLEALYNEVFPKTLPSKGEKTLLKIGKYSLVKVNA